MLSKSERRSDLCFATGSLAWVLPLAGPPASSVISPVYTPESSSASRLRTNKTHHLTGSKLGRTISLAKRCAISIGRRGDVSSVMDAALTLVCIYISDAPPSREGPRVHPCSVWRLKTAQSCWSRVLLMTSVMKYRTGVLGGGETGTALFAVCASKRPSKTWKRFDLCCVESRSRALTSWLEDDRASALMSTLSILSQHFEKKPDCEKQ